MAAFGDLLRLARQLRGYTQKRTSEELGIAQAVLSRLENGLIDPDEQLIEKASRAFRLPESFFSMTDTIYGPPVSVHAMLRGKADISARDIDMITAELNIRLMHLRVFLENVDFNSVLSVPQLDIERYESPEKVAAIVRAHWKLPRGPVKNLTRLLEQAGIIVADSDFHGAGVSGVTFAAPGRPPIVLINRDHPADRIRFTLAHELGHLVMHQFPTPDMEDEANRFASALLLPPEEVKEAFAGRKVTLELLASLKREWKVSMQGLLMSAQRLRAVSDNQARYLWQQISARGWRTKEPASLDFPHDPPSVLPSIIKAHVQELGFAAGELFEMSRLYEEDFTSMYGDLNENKPMRPRLRIVG
jgi:Zn-dependent peptidase ImmA (M78 family)/transcriptional regulator with XRE-family HTH domain